jgi:DNA invertase Pin-like site-specific DNA recombinase
MSPLRIGYARESSKHSSKDLAYDYQIQRLQEYGCDQVFGDWMSGRRDNRKHYREALDLIVNGEANEIGVCHLTRLGRSIIEIQRAIKLIAKHKAKLTVLGGTIDITTPEGRAFVNTQAVWAEYEADLGTERARVGWENSIKQGRARVTVFGYKIQDGVFVPDDEVQPWGNSRWNVAQETIAQFF